jgi:chemotaxis protein methyltransferase CheR
VALQKVEFELLRDLIRDRFGLYFTDDTAYLMERRLLPRLETLGMRSFAEYHTYLLNPALPDVEREREFEDIFERLATRETYFFRESYQLDALREKLLPRLFESRRHLPRAHKLALWSAGCASGEEAYSLAIQILESGLFADWEVSIVGSDLSRNGLEVARRGVYGPSSFRGVDKRLIDRYFHEQHGRYQIDDSVRRLCTFTRVNLAGSDWAAVGGPFDAIFCRNVLIYFERTRRLPLIEGLSRKLAHGGYLFLGHSESLLDMETPFSLDRLGGELVYKRSGDAPSGTIGVPSLSDDSSPHRALPARKRSG